MRYMKGTIDFGLYYDGSHEYRLYGYTGVDWAGSISDRRSTLGNNPVLLLARLKQKT